MIGRVQGDEFVGKSGSLREPVPAEALDPIRAQILSLVGTDPCALLSDDEVAGALGTAPVTCELAVRDPRAVLSYGPVATWSTEAESVLYLQLVSNETIALNDGIELTVDDLYSVLDDSMNATLPVDLGLRGMLGVINAPPFEPTAQVQLDRNRVLHLIWHTGGDMFLLEPLAELAVERWQIGRT